MCPYKGKLLRLKVKVIPFYAEKTKLENILEYNLSSI